MTVMRADGSDGCGRDDGLEHREAEFAGDRPPEQTDEEIREWARAIRAEQASVLEVLEL